MERSNYTLTCRRPRTDTPPISRAGPRRAGGAACTLPEAERCNCTLTWHPRIPPTHRSRRRVSMWTSSDILPHGSTLPLGAWHRRYHFRRVSAQRIPACVHSPSRDSVWKIHRASFEVRTHEVTRRGRYHVVHLRYVTYSPHPPFHSLTRLAAASGEENVGHSRWTIRLKLSARN